MEQKRLSVIIVTYNNKATIKECLDSIFDFNDIGSALEVVVVDNGSTDSTMQILNDYMNKVTVVPSENRGFGAGNNTGVKHCHGDYLFFLNPDTILIEPIFSIIVEQLNLDTKLIGGFHLISNDGKNMSSFASLPGHFDFFTLFSLYRFLYFILRFKSLILRNYYPWGADMYMTKEAFQDGGNFDEDFFLNFEEAIIVKKISPPKIIINKEHIIHLESVSKPKGKKAMDFYFDSEQKYFEKYESEQLYSKYKKILYKKLCFKRFLRKKINNFEQEMITRYK